MNSKASVNPTSIKWLAEDEQIVADYFLGLGFLSLKEILDMRVFDLMNMQGLDAVRVEEIIICLYKWLNPNTDIDEAIYIGTMTQPFPYAPWRKKHRNLSEVKVRDLVLAPDINMQAIQHFYDSIRRAFFKSEEYNWREYRYRNWREYIACRRKEGACYDEKNQQGYCIPKRRCKGYGEFISRSTARSGTRMVRQES